MVRRLSIAVTLAVAAAQLVPGVAAAATPSVVWSAPGMSGSAFSVDGSLVVLTVNSSAGGRVEIRQAATGALVRAITSPDKFHAVALSADEQIVAVAVNDISAGPLARKIRIHRVSNGSLVRAIATAATRDLTSLDFSADGQLVAAMDRRSYEQGGNVHVHRVADGSTVRVLTAPATTATVRFSPDGRYLAANDRFVVDGRFVAGVRVFRTDNWSSVLTVSNNALLVRWTTDSASIWTMAVLPVVPTIAQLIAVPGGSVVRNVTLEPYDSVTDVTGDNALVLTNRVAAPRRTLKFTDGATGAIAATYEFASDVFAGDIGADGTLFTYALSTANGIGVHVARMPNR